MSVGVVGTVTAGAGPVVGGGGCGVVVLGAGGVAVVGGGVVVVGVVAGESSVVRRVRDHLVEDRGVPKDRYVVRAYWKAD